LFVGFLWSVYFCLPVILLALLLSPVKWVRAGVTEPVLINQNWWTPNGLINNIVVGNDGTTYLAGEFTGFVSPDTSSFACFDKQTNERKTNFPKVNGEVKTVVADGQGGWYIGGSFTQVGTEIRNGIAHILSDGQVDLNWNPNLELIQYVNDNSRYQLVKRVLAVGTFEGLLVNAIVVKDGVVYIGGNFNSVLNETRNNLAAIDVGGSVTSWNPNANGEVNTLAISNEIVYAGGSFTVIGGQSRSRLAAIDMGGSAISWNPGANGPVYSLVINNDTVYIGGEFNSVGSQARNYLAAIDVGGSVTSWDPNADASVQTLTVDNNTVYVGGKFTTIGDQNRNRLAAIEVGGSLTSWNPNVDGYSVGALAINNDIVYAGGEFTSVGSQTRNGLAVIEMNGSVVVTGPEVKNSVMAVAMGSDICVGGDSVVGDMVVRNHLAAIDAGGSLTSWNLSVNGPVTTLAIDKNIIYAGGYFTSVGGQTRNRLAAIDIGGSLTDWDPNVNDYVGALAINNDIVYAGGSFTSVGGQTRNRLAAIDIGGSLTDWDPSAGSNVYDLAINNDIVYAGGDFTTVGGQTRNRLAAIDIGGSVTDWNPNVGGNYVYVLSVDNNIIYAGGSFTSVGGQARNNLAAIDVGGSVTDWNPNVGDGVYTLAVNNDIVYAGGSFSTIGGTTRNNLAVIDINGSLASWNPNVSGGNFGGVYSLVFGNNRLYVGGDFGSISNTARPYLAVYSLGISDTTPPVMSETAATVTNNTATITWTTDEPANSLVRYGLTSSLGSATPITSTPTTSHSITLSSLIACTHYYYQTISTDAANNQTLGPINTLMTGGCGGETVNAPVVDYSYSQVTNNMGGDLSLNTTNTNISVTLPSNINTSLDPTTPIDIQVKLVETNPIMTNLSSPPDLITSDTNTNPNQLISSIFDIKTYITVGQTLASFTNNPTITLSYTDSQISGYDINTLSIYRHDGMSWSKLDTTNDTTNKLLRAQTPGFSLFAIFGQKPMTTNQSSNSSSPQPSNSPPDPNYCGNLKPALAPDLFQIDANGYGAKLFFTPLGDTSDYFISFSSMNTNAEEHGEQVTLLREGVQSHLINYLKPNTVYYFKVRGNNGCMPGEWSNIMQIKTTSSKSSLRKFYRYSPTPTTVFNTLKTNLTNLIKPTTKPSTIKLPTIKPIPTTKPSTTIQTPDANPIIKPTQSITYPTTQTTTPTQPSTSVNQQRKCFLWWCW